MSLSIHTKRFPIMARSQYRQFSSIITSDDDLPKRTNPKDSSIPSCPVTGMKLNMKHIPSLPIVGSLLNHLFTDSPPISTNNIYAMITFQREKYGTFLSQGTPGFGSGLHGTFYRISDPNEMMKVIRAEGAYPSGIVENMWSLISILRKEGSAMLGKTSHDDNGFLGRGESWKRQRTFLQTGMLHPSAVKGYTPGILKAAQMASAGASSHSDDLNRYINLCSFDMFSTFMLGEFTNCAVSSTNDSHSMLESDMENVRFCHAAIDVMEKATVMRYQPYEIFMNKLGIETAAFSDLISSWSIVRDIGMKKLNQFVDMYERDELNEFERASYLANALDRLKEEGSDGVSKDEMLAMCLFALFVGVDTTSGVISWNLVHLALNPNVQEKLYKEISHAIESTGETTITATTLEKKNTPYLHNILKETHRLTPPFASTTYKRATKSSITIHNQNLPKNSMIALTNIFNDPKYISDAKEFKPERWNATSVANRRGTPEELMDHPMFRDSFGQGARRCPGNRVATNEVLGMVAQLVWDYEIVCPEEVTGLDDVEYDMSAIITPRIPKLEFRPRRRR